MALRILIRECLLPHLRHSYTDLTAAAHGADLLVTHPITFAGPLVAEQYRIPWVSTVLAPMSLFSVYDLPVFPAMPRLARLYRLRPGVSRLLLRLGKWMTHLWSEPVRQLRAEIELPARGDPLYEGQFSPGLTLALFSGVLATPQPDWPPHTQVTGFVFRDEPDGLPPELARFLDAGPAPLVFTLGSSVVNTAGSFYQESLEAVRRLGCRAVLLVGTDPQNRLPEPLPESILAVPYAPHGSLFPRAQVIIHQGGIGTTAQALRARRPMLVVPHAFDQPDNALRVVKLAWPARCPPNTMWQHAWLHSSKLSWRSRAMLSVPWWWGVRFRPKGETSKPAMPSRPTWLPCKTGATLPVLHSPHAFGSISGCNQVDGSGIQRIFSQARFGELDGMRATSDHCAVNQGFGGFCGRMKPEGDGGGVVEYQA